MKVVYLSGGVGGARLAAGLAAALPPGSLSIIVNTGDDFEHWDLTICPDLDTVMYTLAGLSHVERGWGLAEESFNCLEMVQRYGGDAWFNLGDRDLATHILRSLALRGGARLTEVTADLAQRLGVEHTILPMCDEPRPTLIDTLDGRTLNLQTWLVRERAGAKVRSVRSSGSRRPTPEVLAALEAADMVLIGPSNPYVSIDPILGLQGVRERVAARPTVAVSPIVGGRAVKGPLAEMIETLRSEAPSAAAVARHYSDLLDGFVIHSGDAEPVGVRCWALDILMPTQEQRLRLGYEVLAAAEELL